MPMMVAAWGKINLSSPSFTSLSRRIDWSFPRAMWPVQVRGLQMNIPPPVAPSYMYVQNQNCSLGEIAPESWLMIVSAKPDQFSYFSAHAYRIT